MKVIVTGANGFVGREIVDELLERKFEVIEIGGKSSKKANLKNRPFNYFASDISDYQTLKPVEKIGRVDALIHSAGLAHQFGTVSREKFEAVNVRGTENVLRLAVKLKARQFILIGSTAVYGIRSVDKNKRGGVSRLQTTEDAECRPETFYAESKLKAEKAARKICEENNIALTIFRLAPVVGENGAGNAARLIEAIEAGRFLWLGAGRNLKSLVYKRDAARACACVLANKKGGTEIFNLAAAKPIRMIDFVDAIAKSLGRRIPNVKIPAALPELVFNLNAKTFRLKRLIRLAGTVEKWLSDDVYSAEKIADRYDFRAETAIETAIIKQVEACKANGRNGRVK